MSAEHPAAAPEPGSRAPAGSIEDNRRRLLAAIGDPSDLTFVRGAGNLGDELIYAGARRRHRPLRPLLLSRRVAVGYGGIPHLVLSQAAGDRRVRLGRF
ncbi:MAG TPA: hypothetical protein VHR45_08570 [Thermoanaerobaculia bacterium]|nr:hypothetical protein [Thermoanaerobaculia bacterium]